jgi:hypothetical protein
MLFFHLGHPFCCDAHEPLSCLHDGVWGIPPVKDEALGTHIVLDLRSYMSQANQGERVCIYERYIYLQKKSACAVLRWRRTGEDLSIFLPRCGMTE